MESLPFHCSNGLQSCTCTGKYWALLMMLMFAYGFTSPLVITRVMFHHKYCLFFCACTCVDVEYRIYLSYIHQIFR